jgi:radical SAM superfamily enzyme YgiQ (UPF0313 family)
MAKAKILLELLPFWTPQIPPVGISSLKSYLEAHGYEVATGDANVEESYRQMYTKYFNSLREYLSQRQRGNFYNVGHDVLQNHMMAHQNKTDETRYRELIKELVARTFYREIDDRQADRLTEAVEELYRWLEGYMIRRLEQEKPDVLGLSVYKGTLPASVYAFRLTRERYPHIKTVMGGAVFAQALGIGTTDFERFQKYTEGSIDHIIVGEGEQLFLKLLEGELPETQQVYTLQDIGNRTLELETAPVPDFNGLQLQFYPTMAAYSSRSCPFQCSFCTETVYWGKYRKKSPRRIVEELKSLNRKYGNQLYLMCDSLLNPVITGLADEFIRDEAVIYWDGYLRVDRQVTEPETVQTWRRGGYYRARLGLESGSPKVLKSMNKNIPMDQIKAAVFNLADAGIKTTTYWIIGYPGETEEDFQATLALIEEMQDDIYEADCNPFGYYQTGQVDSQKWANEGKPVRLYTESYNDMLVLESWIIDGEPTREETYRRISRFISHCEKLGIANPYSLYDIHRADERWKKLHKNAVPSLMQFKNKDVVIDECKHQQRLTTLSNPFTGDRGFGF